MQAIFAVIAILIGIALGYWLRFVSDKSEKSVAEALKKNATEELAATKSKLDQALAECTRSAGFESLATERASTVSQLNTDIAALRADLASKTSRDSDLTARISQLQTELNNERKILPEKLAILDGAGDALSNQFKRLAGDILDEKSKKLSENSKTELGTILDPLKDQIKDFREKVERVQVESTSGVAELKTLVGALGTLNEQLTEEARNLTTALRGSAKAQGDWGEFILRDLLDKAGLREGDQYAFQQSFSGIESESGDRTRSVRTDVIVYLPGGRNLVIDSKVSLTAYTDCVSATDDDARKAALKAHLGSMRAHVAGLAKSGYHKLPGIEAPDFVVMFVPVEPAFLMALQADAELWADAYKQGILLVGPTTLLYVIRIVNVLWQQERQARNVREVMERGSELYEKFVGFVTDMEMVGESIRKTDQNYTNAMKKLVDGRGNLIRQVEMLKKLGLRTNKSIPKNLLDRADVDQAELALATEAEVAEEGD
jgi:DNA recombination protein RmuC